MDIERADFALLNAVSEDEWAAYLLAGDASTEAIMNKPSHGLPPDELSRHFFKLWSAGLIECSAASSGDQVAPDLQRARDQFVRTHNCLHRRTCALYIGSHKAVAIHGSSLPEARLGGLLGC